MRNRDKQNANLLPAKKGEVRNPTGRPKGSKNRKKLLEDLLNVTVQGKDLNGNRVEMTVLDRVALAQIRKAMNGDTQAYKEIMDGVFGKMKDDIDILVDADVKVSHVIDMTTWK
jgi:hypothetical protein